MNQNLPTDPKEEKKQQKEPDGDQPMENLERTELTEEQKAQIEAEVERKLGKERGLDGGIKLVREKAPFAW